jgi:hypothetical protein
LVLFPWHFRRRQFALLFTGLILVGLIVYHRDALHDYYLELSGPFGSVALPPGLEVRAAGAFVQGLSGGRLNVRAFSLEPWLVVRRDGYDQPLRLRLYNVHADWYQETSGRVRTRNNVLTLNQTDQSRRWPIRLRAELPSHYRIVVFGDSRGNMRLLPRMVDEINALEPFFVVHLGDIVDGGTAEEYAAALGAFQRFHMPVFTAIGNHDVERGGRVHYRRIFAPDYYHFSVGDTLYLFLDNANPIDFWAGAQADWLAQRFARETYRRAVVFMHRPPFDPRAGLEHAMENPIGARRLRSALQGRRVAQVFASHVHGYFISRLGTIPLAVTGGAGAPLVEGGFYHYLVVEISPQDITWQVVRFQP